MNKGCPCACRCLLTSRCCRLDWSNFIMARVNAFACRLLLLNCRHNRSGWLNAPTADARVSHASCDHVQGIGGLPCLSACSFASLWRLVPDDLLRSAARKLLDDDQLKSMYCSHSIVDAQLKVLDCLCLLSMLRFLCTMLSSDSTWCLCAAIFSSNPRSVAVLCAPAHS